MSIKNLTPHRVFLYSVEAAKAPTFHRTSGGWLGIDGHGFTCWDPEPTSARVHENKSDVELLGIRELVEAEPENYIGERQVPTRRCWYGHVEGLPAPDSDTFYIVSLVVVNAARASGRPTWDLLTPGDLIRDGNGEIAGCTSFYRW